MNRSRLITIGITLMFATSLIAQQPATEGNGPTDNAHVKSSANNSVPSVEGHLQFLSTKLDLSEDQQTQARPILQEMHDASQKVMQNKKLSDQERTSKLRACHLRADTKLRKVLNDDQMQKLDQLEQEAHMDLQGNGRGASSR
jgi:hypothetical protein